MHLSHPQPLVRHAWPQGTQPLVSVFSWAFNHVEFIRESIESILIQETTFPVEVIIHDDSSNDGTAEIIREYEDKYPHLFRNILQKENQWSQGKSVMDPLFMSPRGEFVALTHGDDFWISKNKLQKQFEVLQSQSSLSACCSNGVKILHPDIDYKHSEKIFSDLSSTNIQTDELLSENYVITTSFFFRSKYLQTMPNRLKNLPMGDWPLAIWMSIQGNIFFDESTMVAYRIHNNSTWSSKPADFQYLQILKMLCSVSKLIPNRYELSSISGIVDTYFRFVRQAFFQGEVKKFQLAHVAIQECCWRQSIILKKIVEKISQMNDVGTSPSGFQKFSDCHLFCCYLKTVLAQAGEKSTNLSKRIAISLVRQALTLRSKKPAFSAGIFCVAAKTSLQATASYFFMSVFDYLHKIVQKLR